MPGIRYRRQMINGIPVVAVLAPAEGLLARLGRHARSAGWARRSGAVSGHGEAVMRVRSRRYEITVAGRTGGTLRAVCDVGTVRLGPGTRALRAGLPDRAGLWGLVRPVMGLGLDVAGLHLVTRGSW